MPINTANPLVVQSNHTMPLDGRPAHFCAVVMRDTKDHLFGAKRQMFLTEQGYKYEILY